MYNLQNSERWFYLKIILNELNWRFPLVAICRKFYICSQIVPQLSTKRLKVRVQHTLITIEYFKDEEWQYFEVYCRMLNYKMLKKNPSNYNDCQNRYRILFFVRFSKIFFKFNVEFSY